ncbi:S8 family serine peptidase [Anabaena subtropica]|uniref:S8 family serine peptidase n=1 Tax=Anabaena subtropica FACHB-260 TaxID=2692884 RepID=A0ABR8CTB3_9NOST|nr:S8 family serine peptidase [Anabaena subtropica]MBD2345725.1 S8 family serine peptidase [Anabaena subtropica FACHB-260]
MNDRNNSSDFSTTGLPASNLGLVLQRGGEELILEKALDRFTVRFVTDFPVQQLSQVSWGIWQVSITQAHLELYQVPANQIEQAIAHGRQDAIAQARADQNVTFASHAYTVQDNPGTFVYLSDQITIQFAPSLDAAKITLIASQFNLIEDKPIPGLPNAFVFLVSKQATENPIKIANQLQAIPDVLAAEPNVLIQTEPHYKPRDTLYPQQWYLNHNGGSELVAGSHIAVEQAWDITRGVRSVVVAVVDDSFDLNHPDFQGSGKIVAPRDLREDDFLPLPSSKESSHGTACAGLALAEENGTGIVGVAPGCAFMPIRTTGFLDDESIEQIFNWAMEKGASVISCSWGASAVYFPLSLRQKAAITRAATRGRNGKGCVVLFAAGNANRPVSGAVNEKDWPDNVLKGVTDWLNGFGVHPDVMTIAASTSMSKKAAYSNWGKNIALCAPSNNASPGMSFPEKGFLYTQPTIRTNLSGLEMLTTDIVGVAGYAPGDFTSNFGGTSSATPVVAGVAALVLSANPDLTAQQVKQILETTADKIVDPNPDPQLSLSGGKYDENGHSQWFGYGKVNAARAVQTAFQQRTTSSDASKQVKLVNSQRRDIPDNNIQGIKSVISISDSSTVKDIQVAVNLTHDFLGDIEIYLIAPNNQQVLLQNRTLGNRTDLQTTYGVRSHPILKLLLSQSAKGNWQLWIIDYSPQDVGTLNSWELTLGI